MNFASGLWSLAQGKHRVENCEMQQGAVSLQAGKAVKLLLQEGMKWACHTLK